MLSKEVSSTIFKVFGMTQPGIEPRFLPDHSGGKDAWLRQQWQYRLKLPKLYYHSWLAADEGSVSQVLSHVVWWKLTIY